MGPQKEIDLADIDEGKNDAKKTEEDEGARRILAGFEQLNVKFHLVSDDLSEMFKKKKYRNLFDIGVFSLHSASSIDKPELTNMFKKDATVHVETSDQLVILSKDQKKEFRKKIEDKCATAKWKKVEKYVYDKHHLCYQVDKEDQEEEK